MDIGVLGGGNAGAAVAAHLKLLGHKVRLYDAFPAAIKDIIDNGNVIDLGGNLSVQGQARIDKVTLDLAQAVQGAEILICATPAHVHKLLARDVAPYLQPDQTLVLYPGRTGGVLEFRKVLVENGGTAEALIVETQTIAYACRKTGASVNVFGYKQHLEFSGLPSNRLAHFERRIQSIFPNWTAAKSLWHTSLHNIGMLFHPAPTLLNLGRMESGIPFDYYIDGFTPTIAELVEQLDTERLAVASALGLELPTVKQWLESSYGCSGESLYQSLQNNRSYVGIRAPQLADPAAKLNLRYVIEDVPTGLVPTAALAARLQVPTPGINSMIDLADTIYRKDFRQIGRNLAQLGMVNHTVEQIKGLTIDPPIQTTSRRW